MYAIRTYRYVYRLLPFFFFYNFTRFKLESRYVIYIEAETLRSSRNFVRESKFVEIATLYISGIIDSTTKQIQTYKFMFHAFIAWNDKCIARELRTAVC